MKSEIINIKSLPFFYDVVNNGGKIYQVGGAVRDQYMGKTPKDLDIVITDIHLDDIISILNKYGDVNQVGISFGVIKFTPKGGEEIDIVIPRKENKISSGHKGFNVTSDPKIPIEVDLERRDFTINSIAKDSDGNIIDPFNGIKDIDAKLIKLTNPKAFLDDPLRMLRSIQFASRFDFKIDAETFELIKQNAKSINEISKERILIEFDKIVNKGNPKIGVELLIESGLYENIFGVKFSGTLDPFIYVTRNSEFIYWLLIPFTPTPDLYYKKIMKGDLETEKEISALAYLYNNLPKNDKISQRWVYYNINKIAPSMFDSKFVKSLLNDVLSDFEDNIYPKNYSDLKINGNDLINMGLKGKVIGDTLNKLLLNIYSDNIKNEKNMLLSFVKNDILTLNETTEKNTKKVVFYDFDSTLVDAPEPEFGKPYYKEKTGKDYPHIGWWGRKESLNMDVFDIKPIKEIEKIFFNASNDPNTYVVLLTNRRRELSNEVKKILDHHNMIFDYYSFKSDRKDKGDRLLEIVNKFDDVTYIEFYDDDIKNIIDVRNTLIDSDFEFKLYHVVDGKVS